MNKSKRIFWTDKLIESEIKKAMNLLSIDRMPSRKEIDQVLNSSALSGKISKTGGFYHWAKRLEIEIKKSETETGSRYERLAVDILLNKGYAVNEMSFKHPYDLLINDKVKVDIKIAKPYLLRGSRVHTFGINKKYATCDLYILFALNNFDSIERLLIIPSHKLKITTLCIGANSKYNQYINRWDYLDKFNEFYSELA